MVYTLNPAKDKNADLATAERALTELAGMFAADVDIHTFTRPIGVITRDFFLPLDQRYQVTKTTHADFEQTAQEILALTKEGDERTKVTIVLNSIRGMRGNLDNETGLDVMSLLVKTWELAKKVPFSNAKSLVIDNLRHNKDTGGGCYPGIAARLVQPYTVFLKEAVRHQDQLSAVNHHTRPVVDNDDDDDEVTLARAISLSEKAYVPSYNRVVTTPARRPVANHEEDDMAKAIALSLAESAKTNTRNNNNQYQNTLNGGINDEDLALALVIEQSLHLK